MFLLDPYATFTLDLDLLLLPLSLLLFLDVFENLMKIPHMYRVYRVKQLLIHIRR